MQGAQPLYQKSSNTIFPFNWLRFTVVLLCSFRLKSGRLRFLVSFCAVAQNRFNTVTKQHSSIFIVLVFIACNSLLFYLFLKCFIAVTCNNGFVFFNFKVFLCYIWVNSKIVYLIIVILLHIFPSQERRESNRQKI